MKNDLSLRRFLSFSLLAVLSLRLASLSLYPIMDTTEARYAEIARKILETGNWITPQFDYGVPFWGKPPLSFWASAVTMRLAGIDEFGARLAPYLASLATGALFFAWPFSKNRIGKAIGAFIVMQSTAVGFVSSGAVMTDEFLLLGVSLSMVSFWRALREGNGSRFWGYLFWTGLAVGLLSKGPLALVLTGFPIFLWLSFRRKWHQALRGLPWLGGAALMLALSLHWYAAAERATPGFLRYFIVGEHFERFLIRNWDGDLYGGGHGRPWGTIWVYALRCLFPWILLAPALLKKKAFRAGQSELLFLILWGGMPLAFFTFSRNILPAYVLPSIFPFAIFVSSALSDMSERSPKMARIWLVPPAILAILVAGAATGAGQEIFRGKSHKALLSAWDRKSPLVYLDKRPYSAQFYSRGKAKYAEAGEYPSSRATLVMRFDTYYGHFHKKTGWRVVAQNDKWVMIEGGGSSAAEGR
jgi:4-amino-4-deoxy-L-arabinose transferase-like glycosyltransferase